MSEKDIQLIKLAANNPEEYYVQLDDDSIMICSSDSSFCEELSVFGFEFIWALFNYWGCRVEN